MTSQRLLFYEVRPDKWDEAKQLRKFLTRGFVFRGQASKLWPLKTSIERATEQFSGDFEAIWDQENLMLSKFKSRAHQYVQSPPNDNETLEWLALIRHYGGVSRLLDFTESFYIASFFAMEDAREDACVWAINDIQLILNALDNGINLDHSKDYPYNLEPVLRYAESFVGSPNKQDLVLRVVPYRMNERISVQQGAFLFPCNVAKSFASNLCASFKFPFNSLESERATLVSPMDLNEQVRPAIGVVKIVLKKDYHTEAMKDLHEMNIDAASLFPGLEGFARSLKIRMRFLEKLSPTKDNQA